MNRAFSLETKRRVIYIDAQKHEYAKKKKICYSDLLKCLELPLFVTKNVSSTFRNRGKEDNGEIFKKSIS